MTIQQAVEFLLERGLTPREYNLLFMSYQIKKNQVQIDRVWYDEFDQMRLEIDVKKQPEDIN